MPTVMQRPALWLINHVDLYKPDGTLGGYLDELLDWNGGNFRDLILPESAPRSTHQAVRSHRGLGTKTHVQLQASTRTPLDLAIATSEAISAVAPGAVEHDVEILFGKGDAAQRAYVAELYTILRRTTRLNPNTGEAWDHVEWRDSLGEVHIGRPTFLFGHNIPPQHAAAVPVEVFVRDPNLWLIIQAYYGDMSAVREADALGSVSVPPEVLATGRVKLCIGAATEPRNADGHYDPAGKRAPALGTITYKGNYTGWKLGPVDVFSDQLMRNAGYWS